MPYQAHSGHAAQLNVLDELRQRGYTPPCDRKAFYDSEALAREVGKRRALEAKIDLWVYTCPYCAQWHLTSKPQSKHWHVLNERIDFDSYEDITGDPLFWNRLAQMPVCEADQLLRTTKTNVLRIKELSEDGQLQLRIQFLVRRLNDELHFISQQRERNFWQQAIMSTYGAEAFAIIKTEVVRLSRIPTMNSNLTPPE